MAASTNISPLELSIVIPSFNDEEILLLCLESIYQDKKISNYRIIVIDNGSKLPLSAKIKNKFPGVIWLRNKKNTGFASAINQGIINNPAQFYTVLNSDTILEKDCLSRLIEFLKNNPEAAACGPMIRSPQGIIQPSCRRFPSFFIILASRRSVLSRFFPLNRFSRRYLLSNWDHLNLRRVNWIAGTCMVIRAKAWDKIGQFSEDYFMYCEDADWCLRAKEKGWKIYYLPNVSLVHSLRGNNPGLKLILEHHKSMLIFLLRLGLKNFLKLLKNTFKESLGQSKIKTCAKNRAQK